MSNFDAQIADLSKQIHEAEVRRRKLDAEKRQVRTVGLTGSTINSISIALKVPVRDICQICGNEIKSLIFKGTRFCCEDHRKDFYDDHEPFQAVEKKKK